MLVNLLAKFSVTEYKWNMDELICNKSISLEYIHKHRHTLFSDVFKIYSIRIGLNRSIKTSYMPDMYGTSYDNIKFLHRYGNISIIGEFEYFDNFPIDNLPYYVYLLMNSKLLQDVVYTCKSYKPNQYLIKLVEIQMNKYSLNEFKMFTDFTTNEIEEFMNSGLLYELSHAYHGILIQIHYYRILAALCKNANFKQSEYIKQYSYPDLSTFKLLNMTLTELYSLDSINEVSWAIISCCYDVTFDYIKDTHYLGWILYMNVWSIGVVTNKNIYLNDLVEIFNEVINQRDSKLDFIKNYNGSYRDILTVIYDRHDLTTEFIRDNFDQKYYIHFLKHPAIDPFKLYNKTIPTLYISHIFGNPSLSFKYICEYLSATPAINLDHLSRNQFEHSKLYRRVKLYRFKQSELISKISSILNITAAVINIIVSFCVID